LCLRDTQEFPGDAAVLVRNNLDFAADGITGLPAEEKAHAVEILHDNGQVTGEPYGLAGRVLDEAPEPGGRLQAIAHRILDLRPRRRPIARRVHPRLPHQALGPPLFGVHPRATRAGQP
jgi:hypothetical protein